AVFIAPVRVGHERRVERDACGRAQVPGPREADAQRLPRDLVADHQPRIRERDADRRRNRLYNAKPIDLLSPVLATDEETGLAIAEAPEVDPHVHARVRQRVALDRRGRVRELHLTSVEILVAQRAAPDVAEAEVPLHEPARTKVLSPVQ